MGYRTVLLPSQGVLSGAYFNVILVPLCGLGKLECGLPNL